MGQTRLGPAEELGSAEVDLELTGKVRMALPCLANRRQDILTDGVAAPVS